MAYLCVTLYYMLGLQEEKCFQENLFNRPMGKFLYIG